MRQPSVEAIVIGVSAGAFDALSILLPALPADYPLPVMIVIHLRPDKRNVISELLQAKSEIKICEAEDKETIVPGTVYVAPPDYHLLVETNRTLSLSSEERVHYSRPAIDILFETAADAYGPKLLGIVLTGANDDGAQGLRKIIDAGGLAVIQAPDHAFSSEMPRAAIRACPTARVMELDEIALYMRQLAVEAA